MNIEMKLITPAELQNKIFNNDNFVLIDVRTEEERTCYHIGGIHLPLEEVLQRNNKIDFSKEVVFYCEKGIRSLIAIQRLEEKYVDTLFYNLQGGIEAWKKYFNHEE